MGRGNDQRSHSYKLLREPCNRLCARRNVRVMERRMAESSIISLGNDNRTIDISYWCPPSFQNVGITFTGGVDSTALLCMLLSVYPPQSIHIFHVNHYATPVMYKIAAELGIDNITIVPTPTSTHSMMKEICSYVFETTEIDAVYLALDETQVSGNESSKHFNIGVRLPFAHLNKQHTIDLLYKLNRGSIVHKCYSCVREELITDLQHCGQCSQCNERKKGFKLLGIEDNTAYKNKEN